MSLHINLKVGLSRHCYADTMSFRLSAHGVSLGNPLLLTSIARELGSRLRFHVACLIALGESGRSIDTCASSKSRIACLKRRSIKTN